MNAIARTASLSLCLAAFGCGGGSTNTPAGDAATDVAADAPIAQDASGGGDAGAPTFLLTVRGPLRAAAPDSGAPAADAGTFDPTFARTTHNEIISNFRAISMAAGDVTHHVGLGATDPSQFLAFDIWNNQAGLMGTLSNPMFQAAFGALFSGPPTVNVWVPAEGFTTYRLPASAPARLYVFIQATLRSPGEGARTTHNGIVAGSMSAVVANGDVSHTVWLDPMDPSRLLAVDVWTNPAGFAQFASDPMVMAAFGQLFAAPPTVTTYAPPSGWTVYGDVPAWGTP